MSGLTSLVDTMLPSKLAQRVDLVPLKPEVEIAGTDAVASVEKVSNDVRLPSRAAMLRQLGPGLIDIHEQDAPDDAAAPRTASSSTHTTLSAAARAISTILGPTPGIAGAVRGSAPVWSQAGAPVPQQLAAALARTVATSGLFYESHLSQFASGARTLADLAQEPQARLGQLQQIHPELLGGKVQPQVGLQAAVQPTLQDGKATLPTATPAPATTVAANQVSPAATMAPAMVAASTMTDAVLPPNVANATNATNATNIAGAANPTGGNQAAAAGADTSANADAAPQSHNAGASHRLTPASIAAAYNATSPQSDAQVLRAVEPVLDTGKSAPSIVAEAARNTAQVATGMPQDAVALVRQQLELLAVPVFRWSGEVWPGTQMDWELSEERNHPQEDADMQTAPRTWQTRLTMTLPTLGAIEVRLSMVDKQLQAHLAASEETSIALLRNDGDDLRQRFAAAGLQLTGLQVAPLEQKT